MNIEHMKVKFEAYLLTEQRVATNTFNSYQRDLTQFIAFLTKSSLEIETVTSDDLKKFVHHLYGLKLSARSISRKISTLKAFFMYINRVFNIKNSAKDLCFPKIEKRLPTYLSENEVKSILMQAEQDTSLLGTRNTIMLYLLYVSGMRVSELIRLSISDFHFDTGFVSIIGKGGKQRMIPLPASIVSMLKNYFSSLQNNSVLINRNENEPFYLFSIVYGKKIKPISRQSCWIILKKLL